MKIGAVRRLLQNTILGYAPLLFFSALILLFSVRVAFSVALASCLLITAVAMKSLVKRRVYFFSLYISLVVLSIYSVLKYVEFLTPVLRYPSFAVEIILSVTLVVTVLCGSEIVQFINLNLKPTIRADVRLCLLEFLTVSKFMIKTFTIHIVFSVTYYFMPECRTPERDMFLFYYFPILAYLVFFALEQAKLYFLYEQMNSDNLLYVVDTSGTAIGKAHYSEIRSAQNRLCSPYVRIAVVQNGHVLLGKKKIGYESESDLIDLPIGDFVHFGESLNSCVDRILLDTNLKSLDCRFIYRHHHFTDNENRLVFLAVIRVNDDFRFKTFGLGRVGYKFWSTKQIEEELHNGIFSQILVEEYQTLKGNISSSQMQNMMTSSPDL